MSTEVNRPHGFGSLKFSPDGKLVAGVVEGRIYQMDALSGEVRGTYLTGVPEGGTAMEFCFSPDAQYIASGAAGPAVYINICFQKYLNRVRMFVRLSEVCAVVFFHVFFADVAKV